MGQALKLDVFYPHPPERVWRVLTHRQALAAWLMENDFEPCLGHKFQFYNPLLPGLEVIDCEVIALDAPKRLVYTWQERQMPHPSIVTWTLDPVQGGTQLKLEHRGVPCQISQFTQPAHFMHPRPAQGAPQAVLGAQTPAPFQISSALQVGQADLARFETALINLYLDGGWRTALDIRLRHLLTESTPEQLATRVE